MFCNMFVLPNSARNCSTRPRGWLKALLWSAFGRSASPWRKKPLRQPVPATGNHTLSSAAPSAGSGASATVAGAYCASPSVPLPQRSGLLTVRAVGIRFFSGEMRHDHPR
eukprot:6908563-Alexandrium_andersonii.AAC.1